MLRCFTVLSRTESRWPLSYSIADIVAALPVDTLFLGIKRIDHSMSSLLIVSWHSMSPDLCALHRGHRNRQPQLTERQEIIALHSLSLGIVIGYVTPVRLLAGSNISNLLESSESP